jgi:N-acetylglutamate synthase-like GNAT family acetyltransferase
VSVETLTMPAPAMPPVAAHDEAWLAPAVALRTARAEDAAAMLSLIDAHLEEGHLLPRTLAELTVRAPRFVVGVAGTRVVACAELAPLSTAVAEVRSLVVHRDARHDGVGRALVDELVRRARVQGFDTLSALTHGPGYFMRMGFSLVPHQWMREKIAADCQACALFRRCGQSAVVLSLTGTGRGDRPVRP